VTEPENGKGPHGGWGPLNLRSPWLGDQVDFSRAEHWGVFSLRYFFNYADVVMI
jgi:hypothetical protein